MMVAASLHRHGCRHPDGGIGIGPNLLAAAMSRAAGHAHTPPPPVARPSRARIWDLNPSLHCSVIGTCLTTADLQRVMAKVLPDGGPDRTEHDLHSQAVALCTHRNAASKLLHKALDLRHETVIKRLGKLRGEPAVLAAWAEHRRAGDIPGAYWAVLTHPDVGAEGMRRAFGDVHMLSHLVGAANRADIRRLTALEDENAALRAKVERQQQRFHDAVASRDATIRRLGTLAAGRITTGPHAADDDAQAGLRHLVSDLQARLGREAERRERLEQRLAEAAGSARACQARADAAAASLAAAERELLALERQDGLSDTPAAPLPASRVLYVGGRPSATDRMRALLHAAGGVLLMHDGGRHDHASLLPGLIGQADLVVFPVDCVSHDAASTVKRLCRQQSRPWLPLRSSGLGSFLAALAGPAQRQPAPQDAP